MHFIKDLTSEVISYKMIISILHFRTDDCFTEVLSKKNNLVTDGMMALQSANVM